MDLAERAESIRKAERVAASVCSPAELDPVTAALEQLIIVLDIIGLEAFVPGPPRHGRGRKPEDRRALARAFVAKAVLGL